MRLTTIMIQNYKSIPPEGVTISFRDGLVVFVGRNNAGKSNIIEAIGHLLGAKHPSYIEFPETVYHDLLKPIVIEARIGHATYTNGKQAGLSDAQCHGLVPTDRNKEPKPGSGSIQIRLEVPPPGTAEIAGTTPDDGEEGEEPRRVHTDRRTEDRDQAQHRSDQTRVRQVYRGSVGPLGRKGPGTKHMDGLWANASRHSRR